MTGELKQKVDRAIRLLQSTCKDKTAELSYSGGKDSDVILTLAKMAGINYRAIYKNTTIDPPGIIAHALAAGAEVIRPKKTFLQIIEEKGLPNRYRRFCCMELKEYKILDTSIQGIRAAESAKRAARYKEPVVCRFFGSKKNRVETILPILDWTAADVAEFVKEYGVRCHPLYYTEDGRFDATRRLGCMGCPLSKDKGLAVFKRWPRLARAWIRALRKFRETHPNAKALLQFRDEYEQFAYNLFFESLEDFYLATREDLFGNSVDCKKFLEDFFKIVLT